jgi:kynurenine formamidase
MTVNWSRWGEDDERGALNLLTGDTVLAAVRLPTSGRVASLGRPISPDAPSSPRRNPVWHLTVQNHHPSGRGAADDILVMHSHNGTHIDALCHYWGDDRRLFNDTSPKGIGKHGSARLGVDHIGGIVARAVLLDLGDVCPTGSAGHGFEIGVEHIEAAERAAGVRITAGDVVLLATGWEAVLAGDPDAYYWGEPGIGPDTARWLAERDVIAVGADNWGIEAVPPQQRGDGLGVHHLLLNSYGVYLIENLHLADVRADPGPGAYLFVIAALPIAGGTASPVNPLLIS